ncbi:MAG: Cof subfamily protein (haloacid dehalogenase superfamily) [Candidatus Azotimanducaceae bacterium]|jgi:Cof subfamily protein (haloacid dehalogenase superfamily)
MQLIFFDLDGTLLNGASEISRFTKETLSLLTKQDIAYTVATGRTMLSAQSILDGHYFDLPQIYNNGVTIWDPKIQQFTFENLLSNAEITTVLNVAAARGVTAFVHAIDDHVHFIFHDKPRHEVERELINNYFSLTKAKIMPLEALPANSQVTNISMIGVADTISEMWREINAHEKLIAYAGDAIEGKQLMWMDVHHGLASKGAAVTRLKKQLGATNIICFGDSDNDLSMFSLADECYAPENAKDEIKKSANAIIGHNQEDGIAHFLRERFSL